jgi:uncharacterized protein (DUF305 family)
VTDDLAVETESQGSVPPPTGLRWWAVLLIVLAVAGAAFAVGRFSAFGTSPSVPGNSSPEAGFARDMQVHHTQAIEMAMEIYRKTDDPELRILAYDIATTQSGQRGEMYGWLVQWGLSQSGGPLMSWMDASSEHGHDAAAKTDDELRAEMGMASDAELAELAAATGTAADCDFLALMIRHHEGAIPMAEAVIELGDEPRVLGVAQAMAEGQAAEIDAMRAIQSRLACTP